FDPFLEIPSDESKVHIEVLSVLWGNRLPIPDGSLPLSSKWVLLADMTNDVAATLAMTWMPYPWQLTNHKPPHGILILQHAPYDNHDSSGFDQPSQFTPPQNSNQDILVDLYYSEGSDTEDMEIDSLTMEPLDTLLMGDEDSSTNPARETDEFIKSSANDLVPIPRESGVTSGNNLECDMHVTLPFPTTDFREENFDINLPLGEHVVDVLMENEDISDFPRYLVNQILSHSVKNPSSTKRMFDEPLGDDSKPRSYDVTFLNSLFDFNDDYTLCYDNPLFNDEFEDIGSLDPPKSTIVIDESSLLVTPPPLASKQFSLREVERFDPFFSLTQSGRNTRVMETSSFGFHHMSSPRLAAYSPKEVMYRYYHPHLTSSDGFVPEIKSK
ncbi:hypothetical protein Tco_1250612, partial [Tanacetum coccineum]